MKNVANSLFPLILSCLILFTYGCKEDTGDPILLSDAELSANADAAMASAGWSDGDVTPVDDSNTSAAIGCAGAAALSLSIATSEYSSGLPINSNSFSLFENDLFESTHSFFDKRSLSIQQLNLNDQSTNNTSQTFSCLASGTITIDGSLSYESTLNYSTMTGSNSLHGTVDITYNACTDNAGYTIYGRGRARFQQNRTLSASTETVLLNGSEIQRTTTSSASINDGFYAGLAIQTPDSTKFKLVISQETDESSTTMINYGSFVEQGGSIYDHIQVNFTYNTSIGINAYRCSAVISVAGALAESIAVVENTQFVCSKN